MFHMIVRKIFSLLSLVLSCAAMGQTITPEIEKRAVELYHQRLNAPMILGARVPVRIGATTFELR